MIILAFQKILAKHCPFVQPTSASKGYGVLIHCVTWLKLSTPEKLSSSTFFCLPVFVTSCMNTLNFSINLICCQKQTILPSVCHGDLIACACRSVIAHNSLLSQDLRSVHPVTSFRDWVITYSEACPQSSLGTRLISDCCVMRLCSVPHSSNLRWGGSEW